MSVIDFLLSLTQLREKIERHPLKKPYFAKKVVNFHHNLGRADNIFYSLLEFDEVSVDFSRNTHQNKHWFILLYVFP